MPPKKEKTEHERLEAIIQRRRLKALYYATEICPYFGHDYNENNVCRHCRKKKNIMLTLEKK